MLVYDTLSGKVRKFAPLRKGEVRIYTCGPSVYSAPHLGNFRTYVVEDVVKRVLLFNGYRVIHVMNITDIEDKMVRAAKGSMKMLREIASKNERRFLEESRRLKLIPADHYPRATENIEPMVELIKRLMKKGLAYRDERGNIFFDVSRFPRYGMISHYRFRGILGRRIYKDDYFQSEAGDFILWKAWRKSDGDIFWVTELGKGRPGWHIECSAMSIRYLGIPFDIHMGGIDNVFSHHENEIAQSAGATGKIPARYWMHVRHLMAYGRKMSKSAGRLYTVEELRRRDYGYDAIRAFLLTQHYRRRLNFTLKELRRVSREISRCKALIKGLRRVRAGEDSKVADRLIEKALSDFTFHINNDIDTPAAMDSLCSLVRDLEKLLKKGRLGAGNARRAIETIKRMDSVLGIIY
ncbi:MAG: cysteine--tRNA ligase [Candidatus Hadarchaeum sp.]|uniref:cysteine--tRNA ligase n=1 Tax=Candidatus Hadarchaeum sp. TaxID=2883567 RepID=UPI0031737F15